VDIDSLIPIFQNIKNDFFLLKLAKHQVNVSFNKNRIASWNGKSVQKLLLCFGFRKIGFTSAGCAG
jgi:hypothetical protein